MLAEGATGERAVAVWRKFLATDPADRYPSAAAVAVALEPYTRPVRRFPRRWVLLVVASIVLTLAGVAIVARMVESDPPAEPPASPRVGGLPMTADEAKSLQEQWANALSIPTQTDGPQGMQLALIPPGEFGLSTECRVRLTRPFDLATREVTVRQFRQIVETTGHVTTPEATGRGGIILRPDFTQPQSRPEKVSNPRLNWRNPGHSNQTDDHPVCMITWEDATEYCRWCGPAFRLPTEAEMTWAMRCGEASSDALVPNAREVGWHRGNADQPQRVGQLTPNPWGLHDTHGDVAEWCGDRAAPLPSGLFSDYVGSTDFARNRRIFLGYSYLTPAFKVKPMRDHGEPDQAFAHVGLRILRQIEQ